MFVLHRYTARIITVGGICILSMCVASTVRAQGNVVMGFDSLMTMNSAEAGPVMGSNPGWGGFGRFSYGGMTIATHAPLGKYGAFEIRKQGADGSGMGFNFSLLNPNNPIDAGVTIDPVQANMFPLLDRSGYGINFDPAQYVAELVFKPLPGNDGDQLNLTLDTFDGFDSAGLRRGEQWQWNFFNLANPDPVNDPDITGPDADGFYTVRNSGIDTPANSLSEANAGFTGPSYMFEIAPLPAGQIGDADPDFNDFEAHGPGGVLAVPNGARQIHLQTPFDDVSSDDFFAIKSLRLVKINPDPLEVVRLDGHSGFSNRFGSPFRREAADGPINIGGTDYFPTESNTDFANTDQVSRFDQNGFTNIVLKTDDADQVGGLALWQPASSQAFDGTNASVEVTAKLTVPQGAGQADRIILVVKDMDGNDAAAGQGGDEYHYDLLLNQFNTSSMTMVSIPLANFTQFTAGEFVNAGDGQLSNFNLYYLGLETVIGAGAGLVNLEIESIRVMLPAPEGLAGDFNDDGKVDTADYVMWNKSGNNPLPNDNGLATAAERYDLWRANFGSMAMSGGGSGGANVPEPAAGAIGLIALGAMTAVRRRVR
jgi:hypothetical protein